MSIETQYESLEFYIKDFADTKEILEVNKGLVTDADIKIEQIEVAIEAIRKQVPMKPVNYHGTDYPKWVCPRCDKDAYYSLAPGDEKYCSECGQRIDWSEVSKCQ